jgi:hypothetical protein
MIVSDAPVIGAGPLMILVDTNDDSTVARNKSFTLTAQSSSGGSLQYMIRTLPDSISCGYIIDPNNNGIVCKKL